MNDTFSLLKFRSMQRVSLGTKGEGSELGPHCTILGPPPLAPPPTPPLPPLLQTAFCH